MDYRNCISKFFLFTTFLLFCLSSCEQDEPTEQPVVSRIVLSPDKLVFKENESKNVFLSVTPNGIHEWRVESLPEWLSVEPSSGIINDKAIELQVESNTAAMSPGLHSGSIEIIVEGVGKDDLNVEINIEESPISKMTISEGNFDFGYSDTEQNFYIKNEGNSQFEWGLTNENASLSFTPNMGALTAGDSTEVKLVIDRNELLTQEYIYEATIYNNNEQTIDLPIIFKNYKEEKWLLNGDIIDAEYDRNFDKLIAVSSSPNQIQKYDSNSTTVESLDLDLPPTSVSISQDGKFAVVGHDGRISHIDLANMQKINVFPVIIDVYDIVLAPNNWAYAIPRRYRTDGIRCMDLATGNETPHTGPWIYTKTKIKLHPSGNYIYGAQNEVIPVDFEKYDITSGTAAMLYDSPYHGDFDFDGDIWISENGEKLFARSGNVFNSTENRITDMIYDDSLEIQEGERIVSMDYHQNANRIYGIIDNGYIYIRKPSNVVKKFNADFYTFREEVLLPGFFGETYNGIEAVFDSQGYFGFFNSDGTKFHVVLRSPEEAIVEKKWAMFTLLVD